MKKKDLLEMISRIHNDIETKKVKDFAVQIDSKTEYIQLTINDVKHQNKEKTK